MVMCFCLSLYSLYITLGKIFRLADWLPLVFENVLVIVFDFPFFFLEFLFVVCRPTRLIFSITRLLPSIVFVLVLRRFKLPLTLFHLLYF